MKFYRFIQFVVLLVICQHIEAQTITGYVFDAKDGEPIIGATVLNGKNGCMTDFDGKFAISGRPGDKLTFKAFGCSDKKVAAQNNMEVGMGKGTYTKMKRASAATSSTSSKPSSSSTVVGTNAPQKVHQFLFNLVLPPDGEKTVEGEGELIIYDNLYIEMNATVGDRKYNCKYKIACISTQLQEYMNFFSTTGDKDTRYKNPYILLMGNNVFYYDNRNPGSEVVFGLLSSEEYEYYNELEMENILEAYKKKTGAFRYLY